MACLAALQRHGECLALINKRLEEETENPDLFIMRARLHELFRNVSTMSLDGQDFYPINVFFFLWGKKIVVVVFRRVQINIDYHQHTSNHQQCN